AEEKNKHAVKILRLIDDEPGRMLSTILICNNIVNLSASSFATVYAYQIAERMGASSHVGIAAGIATGIITFVILVFGEITPKTFATKHAEKMSLACSDIILFLIKLLTPIVCIINFISKMMLKIFRVDMTERPTITEDELRTFVDVSHEEGIIESEERQMITNIVDFGDALAKDVMIPRLDIAMVSIDITYKELLNQFTETKFARMPVYDESIDNIVGIINLKDFVFFKGTTKDFCLKDLIREPHFTYEYKKTAELFIEMRKDFLSMVIVLDEYGALAGLITMEDLLEEIVGDMRDEYDTDEEDDVQIISEREFLVLGSANLDDIEEIIKLPLRSNDYDSIAGHVINLLAHFPEVGEIAEDEFAVYKVLETEKNRIDKINITLKKMEEKDEKEDNIKEA
ncbi:MAG: hemolysin family protein, partial [Lachnoclostridium sp.]|nr:hemolysin family protein [Lachnoclostridium sp.]